MPCQLDLVPMSGLRPIPPSSVPKDLRNAFGNENKVEVLELLEQGADPNSEEARDLSGKAPLHYACQYGWLDVIELLVEKCKCNTEITVSGELTAYSKATPLHFACQHGQVETVQMLIDKYQCNPNAQDYLKRTPLHYACKCGKVEVAKLLIEKYKCNPNVQDSFERTPLRNACSNGHSEVVLLLVEIKDCDLNAVDMYGHTPVYYASDYKYTDIAEILIEHGADPNVTDSDGNTSLHNACRHGELSSVKCLLTIAKCDPNIKNKAGLTPLQVTSKTGFTSSGQIMKELIEHGADPNVADSDGNTPLHNICRYGELNSVKYLLTVAKCDPNTKNKAGLTPLQVTSSSSCQIIDQLISHGANPNVTDSDGNTPLHNACRCGELNSVKCLLTVAKCDPNVKNKAGQTPLQVTPSKHSDIIEQLISHGANPNVTDSGGNTPLHDACRFGHLNDVKCLLTVAKCDPNVKNEAGLTPLQVTPSEHSYIIDQLIAHGANATVTDSGGNTPLHDACRCGELDSVKCLLTVTVAKCDPNVKNKAGQTPLHLITKSSLTVSYLIMEELIAHGADPNMTDSDGNTPIHYACKHGELNSIKCLLTIAKYDQKFNTKNKAGLTPLQVTSSSSHQIMKKLIEHGVNPNVTDSDGNTPLHNVCKHGELNSVKCLLAVAKCDPNVKNKAGLTPLHLTTKSSSIPSYLILKELIKHGANANVPDSDGNTPLHTACKHGSLNSIKCLLKVTVAKCDPNVKNKAGQTPVHLTTKSLIISSCEILEELIAHGADPNVADSNGNTTLHIACRHDKHDSVNYLLTTVGCDPNIQNVHGRTPLQMTSNTSIIRTLIRHGANVNNMYKHHGKVLKQPLQPPVKVFGVGNPRVGKSTLTAALQKESSFFGRVFTPKQKITGQDERTAGIVPHEYESKEYGYVTFYDFAGQREFYGSHAAVLKNAIHSFPPIFLVVVDLCESEDEIVTSILYWSTFLENQCASVTSTPHVIIVGSHADVLKERGENPISKIKLLQANTTIQVAKFILAGFITMDCQDPESRGMSELRQCLKTSCNALRTKETISFNSHCFYVYLVDKFRESFAVTVEQIQTQIKSEESSNSAPEYDVASFIPDSLPFLCKICDELNDRGHVLFLKDSGNIEQSWVVINKRSLLEEVTGSVFAPEHFKQHAVITQCSCSTGVVPLSSIAKSFPEHNPRLLTKYLSCLEFCHEISDPEVVHCITAEHQTCVVNGPSSTLSDSGERYFLFPALVSLNVPANVWDDKSEYGHHFGWILHCSNERQEHFFTSRFLQVLILRMAATHPFPLAEGDEMQSNPAIQKNCSIWKSGIFWGNDRGVETLVEVLPDNKAVVVLMRCGEAAIVDLVHLRSQVIQQVLQAAEEHCSCITTVESFIDPFQCIQYPLVSVSQLKLYSISNTSKALVNGASSVVSPSGTIVLDKLVQCESYAGLGEDILWEIFSNQEMSTEIISDDFLIRLAEVKKMNPEKFIKAIFLEYEDTSPDVFFALKTWRNKCAGTYKNLKEKLDEFSLFAGRNLLILAGVTERRKPVKQEPPSPGSGELTERELPVVETIPLKSDKPTLKQLQYLKCNGKEVTVIQEVAADWQRLAIALGFEKEIKCIRDSHHESIQAAIEVFSKWLEEKSILKQPITWDTLIQCLRNEVKKIALADNLAEALKEESTCII